MLTIATLLCTLGLRRAVILVALLSILVRLCNEGVPWAKSMLLLIRRPVLGILRVDIRFMKALNASTAALSDYFNAMARARDEL